MIPVVSKRLPLSVILKVSCHLCCFLKFENSVCQKKFNNKIKKQLFFTGQQKDVRLKSNTTASVLFNYLISYCDTD